MNPVCPNCEQEILPGETVTLVSFDGDPTEKRIVPGGDLIIVHAEVCA